MAAVAFSTTASFNACFRLAPLCGAVIYSPTLSFKSSQLSASRSSRQCRRYMSSLRPNYYEYLPQHRPMQLLPNSVQCLMCASSSRWLPFVPCSSFATLSSSQQVVEGDVNIQYRHGLPVISLTLPSRGERCEFALRPITETVADFCAYVRKEDRGVDTVALYNIDGTKISGSTSIEHLMRSDFHIRINDKLHLAQPPKHASLTAEHVQQLNDIKALVASLHASLNADEHVMKSERELVTKLESVQQALEPLEKQRQLLAVESDKRTNRLMWIGLALMGVQLGAFARLTWFEYSWDIMEPVTYFATYTAAIGGYAYFVSTRIQYEYPDAKERIALNKFYKICKKRGFDVVKYNRLKEDLFELERDLQRLRRQPTFSTYKNLQSAIEQTITVVRDVKAIMEEKGTGGGDGGSSKEKS